MRIMVNRIKRGGVVKAGRDHMANQPGRQDKHGQAEQKGQREDGVDQIARQLPGGVQIALGQQAAEDGDEGMRQSAAGYQNDDELRDAIGGHIGVQVAADAEDLRDDQGLYQADQFGGGEGDHDREGGAGDAAVALPERQLFLALRCHSTAFNHVEMCRGDYHVARAQLRMQSTGDRVGRPYKACPVLRFAIQTPPQPLPAISMAGIRGVRAGSKRA